MSLRLLRPLLSLPSSLPHPLPLSVRPYTSSSSSTPASPDIPPALAHFIASLPSSPPQTSTELLDAVRAAHLHRTLPTRQDDTDAAVLRAGDFLPPGWVWAYFQPESWVRDLGADGSSVEYNAPPPYTRRMWASGTLVFPSTPTTSTSVAPLRIGHPATSLTRVSAVRYSPAKDLVFVTQARAIWAGEAVGREEDAAVREERVHVFRRGVAVPSAQSHSLPPLTPPRPPSNPAQPTPPTPASSFTYLPTPALLFRFSALTFNAHLIHYSPPHAQSVEGHPDLLVHGPLSALILLELAGRAAAQRGRRVRRWEYRALRPVVVGREVENRWVVRGAGEGEAEGEERVEGEVWQDGQQCMWGVATLE